MRRAIVLLCSAALIAGVAVPAASAQGKGKGNGPPQRVALKQAERQCERSGGIFLAVDGLVFVCLLPGSDGGPPGPPNRADKLERTCERSGGTFIDLDGIAKVCLFPGGSLDLLPEGTLPPQS